MVDKYNETSLLPENVEGITERTDNLLERYSNIRTTTHNLITEILLTFKDMRCELNDDTDTREMSFTVPDKSDITTEACIEHYINAITLKPYKSSTKTGFSHMVMVEDESGKLYGLQETGWDEFGILELITSVLETMKENA